MTENVIIILVDFILIIWFYNIIKKELVKQGWRRNLNVAINEQRYRLICNWSSNNWINKIRLSWIKERT